MWLCLTIALAGELPEAADLDAEETRMGDEVVYDGLAFNVPELQILVSDDAAVAEARNAIAKELIAMGYSARRKGDRVFYHHDTGWRNTVVIHDDGWMYIRKRNPHIQKPRTIRGAWWEGVPVVEWTPCLVNPLACVSLGSWTVRPQLIEQDKERVAGAAGGLVADYGDAVAGRELAKKVYEDLPDWLDGIWYEGTDAWHDVPPYETPEERRRAILDYWISRTDNPYGDAVRVAVEQYILFEIQTSPTPYTDDEIAWANATRRCERELVLPEAPW
ncbi:MAG TPA: hypothetical protein QGF58_11455 [Myxococcota bacterium]|nr:hypothetical protein [Myxococcota bacterium]